MEFLDGIVEVILERSTSWRVIGVSNVFIKSIFIGHFATFIYLQNTNEVKVFVGEKNVLEFFAFLFLENLIFFPGSREIPGFEK